MIWTKDLDAILRKYFTAGYSCGRIAMVMDLTLGSVSGRAHRLKLKRPPEEARKRQQAALAKGTVVAAVKRKERAWGFRTPMRTKALPPISDEEAAGMIREAVRAGKVTRCPTRFCAPVIGAPK